MRLYRWIGRHGVPDDLAGTPIALVDEWRIWNGANHLASPWNPPSAWLQAGGLYEFDPSYATKPVLLGDVEHLPTFPPVFPSGVEEPRRCSEGLALHAQILDALSRSRRIGQQVWWYQAVRSDYLLMADYRDLTDYEVGSAIRAHVPLMPLISASDALAVSLYVDRADWMDGWLRRLSLLSQIHCEICPQMRLVVFASPWIYGADGGEMEAAEWMAQVEAVSDVGADLCVFVEPHVDPDVMVWNPNAPWWRETLAFMETS